MSEGAKAKPAKAGGRSKAKRVFKKLKRNKWRYLSLTIGFFLIVAPLALFVRAFNLISGADLPPDVHTLCYRVPLAWLSGPGAFLIVPLAATAFVLMVIGLALVLGPLFCGWLCPIGALSEGLSRAVPLPNKYRVQIKDPRITAGLRYGFFAGFLLVAYFIGQDLVAYQFGGVTCRYCSSYLLQSGVNVVLGTGPGVDPWHPGIWLTLAAWLVIGGIFMVGGRGWCLFFCPVGALSGLAHKLGSSIGLMRMEYNPMKCRHCKKCSVSCPMMAIDANHGIEKSLCIGCRECSSSCPGKAYSYGRKKIIGEEQRAHNVTVKEVDGE